MKVPVRLCEYVHGSVPILRMHGSVDCLQSAVVHDYEPHFVQYRDTSLHCQPSDMVVIQRRRADAGIYTSRRGRVSNLPDAPINRSLTSWVACISLLWCPVHHCKYVQDITQELA